MQPDQMPQPTAVTQQEETLRGLGYGVRNTFVEPLGVVDPNLGEPCVRRAISDPTTSWSSSAERDSDTRPRAHGHRQLEQRGGSTEAPEMQLVVPPTSAKAVEAARSQSTRPQQGGAQTDEGWQGGVFSRIVGQMEGSSHAMTADEPARDIWKDPALRDLPSLRNRAAAQGLDLDAVLPQVPIDDEGRLTSLGSSKHLEGKCQPCAFCDVVGSPVALGVGSAAECAAGILCRYCHFPHTSRPKVRLRPCKGRRERYRQVLTDLKPKIEEHPEKFDENFAIDASELVPNWIKGHHLLKEKLRSWVVSYAAKCPRSRDEQGFIRPSSSLHDNHEQLDALVEVHLGNLGAASTSSAAASSSSAPRLPPGLTSSATASSPYPGTLYGMPVVSYFDDATGVETLCFSL